MFLEVFRLQLGLFDAKIVVIESEFSYLNFGFSQSKLGEQENNNDKLFSTSLALPTAYHIDRILSIHSTPIFLFGI